MTDSEFVDRVSGTVDPGTVNEQLAHGARAERQVQALLANERSLLLEITNLRQTANEVADRRRHLEDVSCRQQNEIKRLKTRITNLWYALDRAKHGAEYCDELGDIIDRALTVVDTGDEMHQVLGEALAKGRES